MNVLKCLLLVCLMGGFSFLSADAMSDFKLNATPKVKSFVKEHNIKIVGASYVTSKIKDGTRKNAQALILDARPVKKYEMGHIPSARALPDTKYEAMKDMVLKDVPKNKEIIAYCGGYHCVKSAKLAAYLKKDGFSNVMVYQAGMPEWNLISYKEISTPVAKAMFEKRSALFIDARPYGKFAGSTIIGSLSIPDTKFKQFSGFLPTQSKTPVVIFCGGYNCHKSHIVAKKLLMMGYSNVNVYAAGFPEWKKEGLPTTGGGLKKASTKKDMNLPKTYLKAGADTGTVDGEWFVKNYKNFSDQVVLVNIMAPDEFKLGHIKGSINIHAEKLSPEELLARLPKDKEIVFYCGTGTRALEAHGMLADDLKYKNIHMIKYLDANIECDQNNQCKIEPNEPLGI